MTHTSFAAAARAHGISARAVTAPFVTPPGIEDAFVLERAGVRMHVGLHISSGPGGAIGTLYVFAPVLVDVEDRMERRGLRFETRAGTATVGQFTGLAVALRPPGTLQAAIVLEIEATDSLQQGRWDLLLDAVDRGSARVAEEVHRLAPRIHQQLGGRLLAGVGAPTSPATPDPSTGVACGAVVPAGPPSRRTQEVAAPRGRRGDDPAPTDRSGAAAGRATSRLRRQRYLATVLWLPYSILLVLGLVEHVFGPEEDARELSVDFVDGQLSLSTGDTVSTSVVVIFVLWLLVTAGVAWLRTDRHEVGARSFGENVVLYLARPGRIVVVALVDLLVVMLPRLALAWGLAAGLSLLLVAQSLPESYRWGNQYARGTKWTSFKIQYVAAALGLLAVMSMVVATEAVGLGTPIWGPPLAAWDALALEPPSRFVGFLVGLSLIALPLSREVHLVRAQIANRHGELHR